MFITKGFFLFQFLFICNSLKKNKLLNISSVFSLAFVLVSCGSTSKPNERDHKQNASIKFIDQLKLDSFDLQSQYTFDTFFSKHNRLNKLSGQYLFASKDKVYFNSFGKMAELDGTDIGKFDVFQIASVSKFITSLCIGRLVEDGMLSFKDTIQKFLPHFKYENITIHHLLSHTSGLPEYIYLTDTAWLYDSTPKTNQDAYKVLTNCPLHAYHAPGTCFDYCNSNYMILAFIAEQITAKPFSQIVNDYIKIPLGLDSLHVYEPNDRIIEQYNVKGMRGNHALIHDHFLNHISGDKGIFINVYELFIIYKAFKANAIVTKKTRRTILCAHAKVKTNQSYGYGIRLKTMDNGERWNYHNGWWRGYRSYFWFNLKQDKCIIVFTNRLKGGFLNTNDLLNLLADQ